MLKFYKNKINTKKRKFLFWSFLLLIFIFWFVPFVPALKWQSVTVTRWVKPEGKIRVEVGPSVKGWTPIDKISKHAINAIISAEDSRFYTHMGLDFEEIINSAERNIKEGRLARGGSTITQQVVKMAFLDRDKSFIRKFREAIGAVLLEQILTKREIMEWYINLAEFGDSVYGVEKASKHYFKTKPHFLSVEQSIHLALVLPSPNGWSFGLRRKSLTGFGHKRFKHILTMMRLSGYLTTSQYDQAMARGDFGNPIRGYTPPPAIAENPAKIFLEDDSYDASELQSEEKTEGDLLPQSLIPRKKVEKNIENQAEKKALDPEINATSTTPASEITSDEAKKTDSQTPEPNIETTEEAKQSTESSPEKAEESE